MATRAIITHQPDVSCDVCGRRLLRGERPDTFLAAGSRRTVCELCIPRAAGEGWTRESEALAAAGTHSPRARRGRSLLGRLRQRREEEPGLREPDQEAESWPQGVPPRDGWRDAPAGGWSLQDHEHRQLEHQRAVAIHDLQDQRQSEEALEPGQWIDQPTLATDEHAPALEELAPAASTPERLSVDLTAEQAIEIFNASECAARVAGIARALGAPSVTVRQQDHDHDRVIVVVAWELCWYRYEVDLRERPATIGLLGEGTELEELPDQDSLGNAAANERGELSLLGQ